jgi:phosphate transport system substrate-binding protein
MGAWQELDWFTPGNIENIVALVAALLGLLPIAGAIYGTRGPRGKRIGYRVQMDTAIGGDSVDGHGVSEERAELFTNLPGMSTPTLVLLRIENAGKGGIVPADYISRGEDHGLSVVFAGRTVHSVEVIPDPEATYLRGHFDPDQDGKGGLQRRGNTIRMPPVPLNKGHFFKLLVLLDDGPPGDAVNVTGGIQDGRVELIRAAPVDDKPPLFSKFALGITSVLTVCLFLLAAIIVFRQPTPPGCATGDIRLIGSTAFAPAMTELAGQYEDRCPGSTVRVDARGATGGLRELADAGDGATNGSPPLIALSDGTAPASLTQLKGNQVAIVAFALVVNDQVPVRNLTVDRIREIYRGNVTNWSQLGGPRLPIRLVSRDANSGTRDLFRRRILDGLGEPAFTSRDCRNKNDPRDRIIRCELGDTREVLRNVARIPGAIGYSELRAAATKGLHTLNIDGHSPSVRAIGTNAYQFTDVEYAYTNGTPVTGSLTDSFLDYMIRGAGQKALGDFGHVPCYSPDGLERCRLQPV